MIFRALQGGRDCARPGVRRARGAVSREAANWREQIESRLRDDHGGLFGCCGFGRNTAPRVGYALSQTQKRDVIKLHERALYPYHLPGATAIFRPIHIANR